MRFWTHPQFVTLFPDWRLLSNFGQSKVLRSSYIWVVVVPIAAKLLEKMPNEVKLYEMIFKMSLPFSWEMFYFSACAFGIASLIYEFCCPAPVKVKDLNTYKKEGFGLKQFLGDFADWATNGGVLYNRKGEAVDFSGTVISLLNRYSAEYLDSPEQDIAKDSTHDSAYLAIKSLQPEIQSESDTFWSVMRWMVLTRPLARASASVFYGLGAVCLAAVFIENFWFVINIFLSS